MAPKEPLEESAIKQLRIGDPDQRVVCQAILARLS